MKEYCPGWALIDIQSFSALIQRFLCFQRCSELNQPTLILTSLVITDSEMNISEHLWFSAKHYWQAANRQGPWKKPGSFPLFPPPPPSRLFPPPPVEAVAAATSVFTEYVIRLWHGSRQCTQISSTLQEADCLLKLVKVNKQVFPIPLLSRNLNHTAQLSIS